MCACGRWTASHWNPGLVTRRSRPAERKRRRPVSCPAPTPFTVAMLHKAGVYNRPGGSGIHGLDRAAARHPRRRVPLVALPAHRRGAGRPRPCQRAYLALGVLVVLVAAGALSLPPTGRSSSWAGASSGC